MTGASWGRREPGSSCRTCSLSLPAWPAHPRPLAYCLAPSVATQRGHHCCAQFSKKVTALGPPIPWLDRIQRGCVSKSFRLHSARGGTAGRQVHLLVEEEARHPHGVLVQSRLPVVTQLETEGSSPAGGRAWRQNAAPIAARPSPVLRCKPRRCGTTPISQLGVSTHPSVAIRFCHHFSVRGNILSHKHSTEGTQTVLEPPRVAEGSPRHPAGVRGELRAAPAPGGLVARLPGRCTQPRANQERAGPSAAGAPLALSEGRAGAHVLKRKEVFAGLCQVAGQTCFPGGGKVPRSPGPGGPCRADHTGLGGGGSAAPFKEEKTGLL